MDRGAWPAKVHGASKGQTQVGTPSQGEGSWPWGEVLGSRLPSETFWPLLTDAAPSSDSVFIADVLGPGPHIHPGCVL